MKINIQIAEIINAALDDYFPDPSIQIIAEPGRFYVSSAYTLATNIHSIRTVTRDDAVTGVKSLHNMYFINDGVYGSFNCILYDHQHVVALPLKVSNSRSRFIFISLFLIKY